MSLESMTGVAHVVVRSVLSVWESSRTGIPLVRSSDFNLVGEIPLRCTACSSVSVPLRYSVNVVVNELNDILSSRRKTIYRYLNILGQL
jgi:hypothetical protein